jgi:hypothetical protein
MRYSCSSEGNSDGACPTAEGLCLESTRKKMWALVLLASVQLFIGVSLSIGNTSSGTHFRGIFPPQCRLASQRLGGKRPWKRGSQPVRPTRRQRQRERWRWSLGCGAPGGRPNIGGLRWTPGCPPCFPGQCVREKARE